jgi:hypothetical protein
MSKFGWDLLLRFEISCSVFDIFLPVAIRPLEGPATVKPPAPPVDAWSVIPLNENERHSM